MTRHNDASNLQHDNSARGLPKSALWWLAGAIVLLFFSDGKSIIALAAWLAPACLLRFVRLQPALRGLAIAYAALLIARGVILYDVCPLPGLFYFVFLLISCAAALLPYLADRLLTQRLNGFAATLVFPVVLVATEFVYSYNPYGSWGSVAYTQSDNLPLLQSLSVTGLWGIIFLIGWFAGSVNFVLQEGLRTRQAMCAVVLFGGVYLFVVASGEARLALAPVSAPTVRVATLSPVKNGFGSSDNLLAAVIGGNASQAEIARFDAAATVVDNDLLERSAREAEAGAKIIFWSEAATHVLKQDEQALLRRGSALATKYRVYLGMAFGAWTPGSSRPLENKFVLIEPTGKIAWQFYKARPVPGSEAAMSRGSDGKLPILDTPYGRLTAAICFDTDFSPLIAQAGKMGADLILSPANDGRGIDPMHTKMASFRAIEQGANLIRQSNNGFSAAYDYQGRQLASMDAYQASNLALVAQVPTRGVHTLYSRFGDWLAWLSIASLFALLLLALRGRRNPAIG